METASMAEMGMAMGGQNDDDKLLVRFFTQSVLNKTKTMEAGCNIYDEEVLIDIKTPGNSNNAVHRADERYKARFPRHWAAFKDKQDQSEAAEGFHLKNWPALSKNQVDTLVGQNVFTVEQLANVSDGSGLKIMGLQSLKRQANDFLKMIDVQKGANEMAELRDANASLTERLEALESAAPEKKPRAKRRTKAEMEAAAE
jgi:hypothetical protein